MTRRTTLAAALALTLGAGIALTGCGSDSAPDLKVSGAYLPAPAMTDMAGGFLTLKNTGDTADKLTSVTSDISDDVTIHTTVKNQMKQVTALDIPANGELSLERGGNHLMFMKLEHKPKQGEKVELRLHFEKSDPIKVEVPVVPANHNPQK